MEWRSDFGPDSPPKMNSESVELRILSPFNCADEDNVITHEFMSTGFQDSAWWSFDRKLQESVT